MEVNDMKVTLSLVELALGIWLIASPWFLGYASLVNQLIDLAVGIVVVVCAATFFVKNKDVKQSDIAFDQLHCVVCVLGIALVAEAIVGGVVFGYGISAIVSEAIVGVLLAALGAVAPLFKAPKSIMVNGQDGSDLLILTKVEYKDGNLAMKGKAFGTMPMLMKLENDQLWRLLGYLSFSVIAHLPSMLIDGYKTAKKKDKEEAARKAASNAKRAAAK